MSPQNIKEYKEWIAKNFDTKISSKTFNYYDLVTRKLKSDFERSIFWQSLINNLEIYNDEYYLIDKFKLFRPDEKPEIFIKPFDSFLLKTFRKNIINNESFPEAPNNGWVCPENWYERVCDIVRTTIVVKYLDGVEFIANKIKSISEEDNFNYSIDYEAREEGYYAAHITLSRSFEIPDEKWETKMINFNIEIQITTQLQEVIKILLHQHYERNRELICKEKNIKWQWDYKSEEFSSNYIGHILHYVEGMIMEIRDKQK
jgi:hypothetical protein